jgi:hypothetical protein
MQTLASLSVITNRYCVLWDMEVAGKIPHLLSCRPGALSLIGPPSGFRFLKCGSGFSLNTAGQVLGRSSYQ